ncbi:uncharacterized protein EDB91DRAFT_1127236 [Suillus paluster]|uniref:uncharacterized protein n=1 Tax=Suillus paluster TaxID=48578 RepID=UPI001B860E09|nr:uncharacterized protein EDB91DRAFT_1127236 [Suillus paluster]KAG1742641.1 hypothetical protein EDB91DRAFT_1127236 [Suillus paluster]
MTPAGGLSPDAAAMVSIVLESILYGFSVLMFIGTIWALTYQRRMQEVNRLVTVVAVLLLMLSTAHMIVEIVRTEEGLVKYRDTYPGGPAAFFTDESQPTFVVKNLLYVLQTLLGDIVVIYRCYVVWRTVWVIILPSILWCGVAVTGAFAVYSYAEADKNIDNIFTQATSECIGVFCALTLATNLLSSGLLAYRIWKIERNVSASRTMKVTTTSILRVIMDAALLYSIALLFTIISSLCSSNGAYVVVDMVTQIISITFYMVIIRIALGRKFSSQLPSARGGTASETQRGSLAMKPLQVHVSKFTQSDSSSVYGIGSQDRSSTYKESADMPSSYV